MSSSDESSLYDDEDDDGQPGSAFQLDLQTGVAIRTIAAPIVGGADDDDPGLSSLMSSLKRKDNSYQEASLSKSHHSTEGEENNSERFFFSVSERNSRSSARGSTSSRRSKGGSSLSPGVLSRNRKVRSKPTRGGADKFESNTYLGLPLKDDDIPNHDDDDDDNNNLRRKGSIRKSKSNDDIAGGGDGGDGDVRRSKSSDGIGDPGSPGLYRRRRDFSNNDIDDPMEDEEHEELPIGPSSSNLLRRKGSVRMSRSSDGVGRDSPGSLRRIRHSNNHADNDVEEQGDQDDDHANEHEGSSSGHRSFRNRVSSIRRYSNDAVDDLEATQDLNGSERNRRTRSPGALRKATSIRRDGTGDDSVNISPGVLRKERMVARRVANRSSSQDSAAFASDDCGADEHNDDTGHNKRASSRRSHHNHRAHSASLSPGPIRRHRSIRSKSKDRLDDDYGDNDNKELSPNKRVSLSPGGLRNRKQGIRGSRKNTKSCTENVLLLFGDDQNAQKEKMISNLQQQKSEEVNQEHGDNEELIYEDGIIGINEGGLDLLEEELADLQDMIQLARK